MKIIFSNQPSTKLQLQGCLKNKQTTPQGSFLEDEIEKFQKMCIPIVLYPIFIHSLPATCTNNIISFLHKLTF